MAYRGDKHRRLEHFSAYQFLLQCSRLSSLVVQEVLRSEWGSSLEMQAVALTPCSGHREVSGSKNHNEKYHGFKCPERSLMHFTKNFIVAL